MNEYSRKWPSVKPKWLDTKMAKIESYYRKKNKGREHKDKPEMIKLSREEFIERMVKDQERRDDGTN